MAQANLVLNDDSSPESGWEMDDNFREWTADVILQYLSHLDEDEDFRDKYEPIFTMHNITGIDFSRNKLGNEGWCRYHLNMTSDHAKQFSNIVRHRIIANENHNRQPQQQSVVRQLDDPSPQALQQIAPPNTNVHHNANMNDDKHIILMTTNTGYARYGAPANDDPHALALNDDASPESGWAMDDNFREWTADVILQYLSHLDEDEDFRDKYEQIFTMHNITGIDFTRRKLGNEEWCRHNLNMTTDHAKQFSDIVRHRITANENLNSPQSSWEVPLDNHPAPIPFVNPDMSFVSHPKPPMESMTNKFRATHHKRVQVIDTNAEFLDNARVGRGKHPKQWTEDEVATWLCSLEGGKYAKYKAAFVANEFDGEDFAFVCSNESLLKDYDVKKPSHRNAIVKEIQQLLNTHNRNDSGTHSADDDDEKNEMKAPSDSASYNNNIEANKPVTRVDNGLVMFCGISEYDGKTYKNLTDIADDERSFRKTFAKEFGYRFISNQYNGKKWYKADVLKWIQSKRDEILLRNGRVQYNALIFCGASHGSMHSIICSDGATLEVTAIRSIFASSVKYQFRYLPKIFIFNCCRTPYAKVARGPSEATGAAGYGMTITGSEGKAVFGPKLSSFVADAFSKGNKQKLYDIYRNAKKKAQNEMGLALQEYDTDVGEVIFMKKAQSRGSGFCQIGN